MSERDTERIPVEVLADEFVERQRRGERPTVEEYTERYPDLAEEILKCFPAIAAMENLKDRIEETVDLQTAGTATRLKELGDFRIISEIGRGGMGVVYEAEQRSLGRRVAVKVLLQHSSFDERQLKRFKREASTAAQLHHTNIVPIYGVGEHEGIHFYVMQFIEGVGLDKLLAQLQLRENETAKQARDATGLAGLASKQAREADLFVESFLKDKFAGTAQSHHSIGGDRRAYFAGIARMGVQVADALEYAHGNGVLHRDIKPANLLLDAQRAVWVADFGLAKAVQHDDISRTGDIVGTLRYMAPEQLAGQADARSDVYSLGLTLYELITLRPAFDASNRARLLHEATRPEPVPPRKLDPNIPRDLDTIVLKAIALEPLRRYQTAGQLAADLRRFLEDRPIRARRMSGPERLWRWCRRNPASAVPTVLAVVLLAVVAVVAAFGYWQTSAALVGQRRERQRAEQTLQLAVEAFDEAAARLAPARSLAGVDDSLESPIAVSEETAKVLQRMLSFYERLAESNSSNPQLGEAIAKANRRVGDIQLKLGNYQKAQDAYRSALSKHEQMQRQLPNDVSAHEIAVIHSNLGLVLQMKGQHAGARESYEQAIQLLNSLATIGEPASGVLFDLATAHQRLASTARSTNAAPAAEASLRDALEVLETLVARDTNNPEYRAATARVLRDLAPVLMRQAQRESAVDCLNRSINTLEALVSEHSSVPGYRFELIKTLSMLDIKDPNVRLEVAAQRYQRAVELAEELTEGFPADPLYEAARARAHTKLAAVRMRTGQTAEAERNCQDAIAILQVAIDQFPSYHLYRHYIAEARFRLGIIRRSTGELAESRRLLEQSIVDQQAFLSAFTASVTARRMLVSQYRSLADILRRLDEDALAKQADQEAESVGASVTER